MNHAQLITEALTALWAVVQAAILWVLAAVALLTLATLGGIALLIHLARLIHPDDPTEP